MAELRSRLLNRKRQEGGSVRITAAKLKMTIWCQTSDEPTHSNACAGLAVGRRGISESP